VLLRVSEYATSSVQSNNVHICITRKASRQSRGCHHDDNEPFMSNFPCTSIDNHHKESHCAEYGPRRHAGPFSQVSCCSRFYYCRRQPRLLRYQTRAWKAGEQVEWQTKQRKSPRVASTYRERSCPLSVSRILIQTKVVVLDAPD
jgi:hypothetical protein